MQSRSESPLQSNVYSLVRSALIRIGQTRLIRLLYAHNPFYLISAWLVFFGLRVSFNVNADSFPTWALTLSVAGYTVLLAATACVLIRLGEVWEDIRSLVILVVLMFFGLSVTLDDVYAANPQAGIAYYCMGAVFVVAVSEALMRGLRLKLGPLFRCPYYLILMLFFLYPVLFKPVLTTPDSLLLQWELFGFSSAAGIVFLTLWPAIRQGAAYVRDNGSPWLWPWYPWTIFGVLACGVCLRAYYLCLSLHFVGYSNSIFGLYFLVPFFIALSALLLESSIVSRSPRATWIALCAPAVWLLLATFGHRSDAVYTTFLGHFSATLAGSPLWLAILAAIAYYAWASWRALPAAVDLIAGSCALLSIVSPSTFDLNGLVAPQPLPLAIAGTLQAAIAIRRHDLARWLISSSCLIAALTIWLQGTMFTSGHGALPLHLLLAVMLVLGACYRGAFARALQSVGAGLLLAFSLLATSADPTFLEGLPDWLATAYPLFALAGAVFYGYALGNRWHFASAAIILIAWTATTGVRGYSNVRQHLAGLNQIVIGIFFFVLAMLISLAKTGIVRLKLARWLDRA